jgi:Cu/Ag efflux pump CusA
MKIINGIVTQFNDVENVYGRLGRGEAGSHAHTVNMGNAIITLKNKSRREIREEEDLIAKISAQIKKNVPGILLNFTQPIKHNLDHLLTGVRADLAIKVYGDDYTKLINIAEEIESILHSISGVADVQVTRVSGQHEIAVKLDRQQLARYGLKPDEVLEDIEAAFGGHTIGRLYQGDIPYDIFIRYQLDYRKNINDLKNYRIQTEKGRLIPLELVAAIQEKTGFATISRENGKRYITVHQPGER